MPKPTIGDLVAGISVALVALPQSLAYAEIAGMPPQYGLYASALPPILAAFFMSSPYLQTGPVALTALLTFGALEPLAQTGSTSYVALAALLALLVGVFRIVLGLIRLGGVAYLLSDPVLTGFTTGAAILITSSQLPKVFDVSTDDDGVLAGAWQAIISPGDWQWSALGFSALTLVLVLGGRRLHALFPGVLIAVVIGVVISAMSDYSGSTVGELDGGFISLTFDFPWDRIGDLVVPAMVIALVGFAEPSSIARTFAAQERQPWDANQEMVSQGVANVTAAVSGAFPVGGSFSRSSLNKLAGARTAWAGAITGGFVLCALPLTPLLEDLPAAVLGSIVIAAVMKLIRLDELVALARANRIQALVGFGTLAVGELDGGFISLTVDFPWDRIGDLVVPAMVIALVGFAEPSSIARTFAAQERQPWDANQEMVSQGVANVTAAVSGAFPVGGSFSRSSLNKLAGARTAWAGAITGGFVLCALPLTPLLEDLPAAVLGSIVIAAVMKLIRLDELVALARTNRIQALVGFGTLAATILSAPRVERGVMIGVVLALLVHLFRELRVTSPYVRAGTVLTIAPEGVLWFATIPGVERQIRAHSAEYEELDRVVLDLAGVGRLDYSAAAALRRIVEEMREADIEVDIINIRQGASRGAALHLFD